LTNTGSGLFSATTDPDLQKPLLESGPYYQGQVTRIFKALGYLLCVSIFFVLRVIFACLFPDLPLTKNDPDPSKVTTDPDMNPKNKDERSL
jgi:hypothetical protein